VEILPFQSELKKGTTFTTIIPFEEAKMQEEIRKSSVIDNKSRQRLSTLKSAAGEDNEFNRMVAEDTLKEILPGIRVHSAADGQEAVNSLKREMYDVVLMDIQMPVMDGVTATRQSGPPCPNPQEMLRSLL